MLTLCQWAIVSPTSKEAARTSKDSTELEVRRLGSISGFCLYFLSDLGRVTSRLWASASKSKTERVTS